jgi:hypothetical protein
MIQSSPIITLRSLHEFGFTVPMLSEFAMFYDDAEREYSGHDPPLMEYTPGWPLFLTNYDVLLIRKDVSREGIRATFKEWVEKTRGRGWGFNVKSMRPCDALQYIDLRIFELINDVYISPSVKASIIRRRHEIALVSEHAPSWQTSSPNYPKGKLTKTRRSSLELLDGCSDSCLELRSAAKSQLLQIWNATSGKGDGTFALPVSDARIWPD